MMKKYPFQRYFIISALSLAFIWSFSIYDLSTNRYDVYLSTLFINIFVFTPILAAIVIKNHLIALCIKNFSIQKFLGSGTISAILVLKMSQQSHLKIFYDIVINGHNPREIVTLLEALNIPLEASGRVIKIICAAAGAAAFFALTVIFLLLCEFAIYLWQKPRLYLLDNGDERLSLESLKTMRTVGFGLLALMVIVMIAFSSAKSFWFDEMVWTIGKIANKSFSEVVLTLLEEGYNMPLYYFVLRIWYPLVPYGEGYLLVISMVSVIIGIIFCYLAAKAIGGKILAFITFCLACVSSILLLRGAWELRPYAFLFWFSAMTLWCYIKRVKEESWRNIFLLALAMALLMYTHWYGAVLLVFYGIGDLFLLAKKKIKIRFMVSYLISGLAVLPWFVLMLLRIKSDFSVNEISIVPKWILMINSLDILFSSNSLLFLIFTIAVIITAIISVQAVKAKKWSTESYLWMHTFLCTIWIIGLTFLYSRYINPQGSIYSERYYFILVPHVLLITAYGIKTIGTLLNHKKNAVYLTALLVLIGIIGYSKAISTVTKLHQPYREVAEILAHEEKAYEANTLILTSAGDEAWLEYYFRKRGYEIPPNVAYGLKLIREDGVPVNILVDYADLYEFDRLYVWYNYFAIPSEFTAVQNYDEMKMVLYEK